VLAVETADVLASNSTLRFRTVDELDSSLAQAGSVIDEVCEAPDRPSREFIVIASPKQR
jgi:hypothetical protein